MFAAGRARGAAPVRGAAAAARRRRGSPIASQAALCRRLRFDDRTVLGSSHCQGTAKMGEDPATSVVDARGESHQVRNLMVCDSSVFPGSCGVNPMLSILTLARYQGRRLAPSARGTGCDRAVEIVAAETGPAHRQFIALPYRLYRGDPRFVAPLRRERRDLFSRRGHPFFAHAEAAFFLARRAGRPVGRIRGDRQPRHGAVHDASTGFFGAFECENDRGGVGRPVERGGGLAAGARDDGDAGAVHALAERGVRAAGRRLRHAARRPARLQPALLRPVCWKASGCGACRISTPSGPTRRRLTRACSASRPRSAGGGASSSARCGCRLRRRGRSRRAAAQRGAGGTRGFVPVTSAELRFAAAQFRALFRPELVLFAEVDGVPAGIVLAMPDFNQALARVRDGRLFPFGWLRIARGLRAIDQLRLLALGVRPAYRRRGDRAAALPRAARGGEAARLPRRRAVDGLGGQRRHPPDHRGDGRAPHQDLPHLREEPVMTPALNPTIKAMLASLGSDRRFVRGAGTRLTTPRGGSTSTAGRSTACWRWATTRRPSSPP